MKKLALAVLSLFILSTKAQNRSIAFEHGTFAEIKAKALKENKLIFIDAYTTWCGPCKWMATNIFTNDTAADYYNKNFVNAKIDMEKGEGVELAKLYQVSCYPTLLFVDGNGALQHRVAGSMPTKDFIALGEAAKDPKQNFSFIKADYEARRKNPEAIIKYIRAVQSTCLDAGTAVNDYFAMQKEENLSSKENWEMIRDFSNNIDSKEFKYLIANRSKFDALYTEKEVNTKIDNVCRASLYEAMKGKTIDEAKYNATKANVAALNTANGKQVLLDADMRLAQKKNDWAAYSKLAVENVDAYYLKESHTLNSIAWNFYEHVTDKAALTKAEEWSKRSTELDMGYANLDTYASVLYKNGKKDLALETANKAIRYAKSEKQTPEDYKSTSELIEKINAMK